MADPMKVEVVSPEQVEAARRFKQLYSLYEQNRDLISVGAYQTGSDPRVDEAIGYNPRLVAYLSQDMRQKVDWNQSLHDLAELLVPPQGQANQTSNQGVR